MKLEKLFGIISALWIAQSISGLRAENFDSTGVDNLDCDRTRLYVSPARETAFQQALKDSEADSGWPGHREIPPYMTAVVWTDLNETQKTRSLYSIVDYQYCEIFDGVAQTIGSMGTKLPDQTHCDDPDSLSKWVDQIRAVAHFSKDMRSRYPYGFTIFESLSAFPTVKRFAQDADVKLSEYDIVRRQCEYGQSRLNTVRTKRLPGSIPEGLGSKPLGEVGLNEYYDQNLSRPGGPGDVAPFAGMSLASHRPVGETMLGPNRGLKIPKVPLDTYASLTDGILLVFKKSEGTIDDGYGGSRIKGSPEDEKKLVIFRQALRYLYDIPRGRQVLREVQEMRGEYEKVIKEQASKMPKTLSLMKSALAEKERKPASEVKPGDLEQRRKEIADAELFMKAAAHKPKPTVLVSIGETDPSEGGHAAAYVILSGDGRFITDILISENWLKDGNPSRALDKILAHELQHIADARLIYEAAQAHQIMWQMSEDRAYLTEARAVMEQRPAMAKEKKSEIVESMRTMEVADMLKDPTGFRLRYLANPLYLWNVTPADLDDPESALRGRLSTAWGLIRYSGDDKDKNGINPVVKRIDEKGELFMAYEQAVRESPLENPLEAVRPVFASVSGDHSVPSPPVPAPLPPVPPPYDTGDKRGNGKKGKLEPNIDLSKAEARFIELASKTKTVKDWLNALQQTAEDFKKPSKGPEDAWKGHLQKAENDFWPDLESFVRQYRSAP